MSAQDLAVQALAELEAKVDAGLEAVRTRRAEAKARLESGMLNLRPQHDRPAELSPNGALEPSWDLESEAAADDASVDQLDELAPSPSDDAVAFDDDEFDGGSDDFEGIPQSI